MPPPHPQEPALWCSSWSQGWVRFVQRCLLQFVSIPRSSQQLVPGWPGTCYEIVLRLLPATTTPERNCIEPWVYQGQQDAGMEAAQATPSDPRRSPAIPSEPRRSQAKPGVTLGVPGTASCRQGMMFGQSCVLHFCSAGAFGASFCTCCINFHSFWGQGSHLGARPRKRRHKGVKR